MVDENGQVVSQLCDENNALGPLQFEQAMRKQAGCGRSGRGDPKGFRERRFNADTEMGTRIELTSENVGCQWLITKGLYHCISNTRLAGG